MSRRAVSRPQNSSRSGTRSRCKAGVHCGHNTALKRRPTRIGRGIATERSNCRADLSRRHDAIQRFGIHGVGVAHREPLDGVTPIELHLTGISTAPAADRSGDDRALNICVFPRITVVLAGVTVTAIDPVGGAGEGVGVEVEVPKAEPRAEQPCSQVVTRTTTSSAASRACSDFVLGNFPGSSCGKGRIPVAMQANNQRKRASPKATRSARLFPWAGPRNLFCIN